METTRPVQLIVHEGHEIPGRVPQNFSGVLRLNVDVPGFGICTRVFEVDPTSDRCEEMGPCTYSTMDDRCYLAEPIDRSMYLTAPKRRK